MKTPSTPNPETRQQGAAAVEFALVAALFFILLFGIVEMGRVLFYWNTAVEATRLGARMAVVCSIDDESIRRRMRQLLPLLASDAGIRIDYPPSDCFAESCAVTVSIGAVPVQTFIPFVPLSLSLPPFATSLTRESMQSVLGGRSNPACQS